MSLFALIRVEFKKLRRSKIYFLLLAATVILWVPSIVNAHLNFQMQAEGISPENNFFIQGFMGFVWFMFPASMIVGIVLINQTERVNNGIRRMLSLPVNTAKLCLSKFVVLLSIAAIQLLMALGMYFISAGIASFTQNYHFLLPPLFVWKEVSFMYLSSIPMLALFLAMSVCIQAPIFSIGIGLVSIVPSILIINTKLWYVYPMAYPFYVITSEYSRLATKLTTAEITLFPWLPIAAAVTLLCIGLACIRYGQAERRS